MRSGPSRKTQQTYGGPRIQPLRDGLGSALLLLLTASASMYVVYHAAVDAYEAQIRSFLIHCAEDAARCVNAAAHEALTRPDQERTPGYERAVAGLKAFHRDRPEIRFVYTVRLVGDNVHFVLDTTDPGDADGDGVEDHSGLMELYEHADAEMLTALREGRSVACADLTSDQWGSVLSGYAPLRTASGAIDGVAGIDISAGEYANRLSHIQTASLAGACVAIISSLSIGVGVYLLRTQAKRALASANRQKQRFCTMFEVSPIGKILFDRNGRIAESNAASRLIFGVADREINAPPCLFTDPNIAESTRESLRTGRGINTEIRYDFDKVMASGYYKTLRTGIADLEIQATPLPGTDGDSCDGYILQVQDVTRRATAQAELLAAKQALERSNAELARTAQRAQQLAVAADAAGRAKGEFLANMSHEIRTPMTAILGYIAVLREEMLESGSRDEAAIRGHLDTIAENGKHLLTLLNDILDLSKIDAGALQLERLACSPRQIVTDVQKLMMLRAGQKGLSLETACDSGVPDWIESDPTRLRQILVNLVGNAIKFTHQGGVTIAIRASSPATSGHLEGPSCNIEFAVTDTGIGIAPDQAAKLFAPFVQADGSTTRLYGGTGLGLAISQRLAIKFGGEIAVDSEIGRGSTFRLRIPCRVRPPHAPPGATNAGLTAGDALEAARLFARILVAEDGPDNQRLIRRILERAGAEVVIVENGRAAVNAALEAVQAGRPFDIILMDVQMPIEDGYSATRSLRSSGYRRPIMALSAHAEAQERDQARAAGCDDYATKPIDRADLLAKLRRLTPSEAPPTRAKSVT